MRTSGLLFLSGQVDGIFSTTEYGRENADRLYKERILNIRGAEISQHYHHERVKYSDLGYCTQLLEVVNQQSYVCHQLET